MPADATCAAALAGGHLVGTPVEPVSGPGECGMSAPLRLEVVVLADGRRIPIEPPTILQCTLGAAIADWVRDEVAPQARKTGSELMSILGDEAFECRGRNRVVGARLSEHGKGNALDLRGFVLKDGRQLLIARQGQALDFMRDTRASACARFATVLGPGSDGFHESHMHVDLAVRRNGYRICHWEIP